VSGKRTQLQKNGTAYLVSDGTGWKQDRHLLTATCIVKRDGANQSRGGAYNVAVGSSDAPSPDGAQANSTLD
jgi:hypothetical protein